MKSMRLIILVTRVITYLIVYLIPFIIMNGMINKVQGCSRQFNSVAIKQVMKDHVAKVKRPTQILHETLASYHADSMTYIKDFLHNFIKYLYH